MKTSALALDAEKYCKENSIPAVIKDLGSDWRNTSNIYVYVPVFYNPDKLKALENYLHGNPRQVTIIEDMSITPEAVNGLPVII